MEKYDHWSVTRADRRSNSPSDSLFTADFYFPYKTGFSGVGNGFDSISSVEICIQPAPSVVTRQVDVD